MMMPDRPQRVAGRRNIPQAASEQVGYKQLDGMDRLESRYTSFMIEFTAGPVAAATPIEIEGQRAWIQMVYPRMQTNVVRRAVVVWIDRVGQYTAPAGPFPIERWEGGVMVSNQGHFIYLIDQRFKRLLVEKIDTTLEMNILIIVERL